MTLPVEVLQCLVCDYAAMQVDGKFTFSGVYTDDIRFTGEDEPDPLTLFICVFVRPTQPAGKLLLGIKTPDELLTRSVEFSSASGEPPAERDRFVLATPILIKAPTWGEYNVMVGTADDVLDPVHTFYIDKTRPDQGTE